MIRGLDLTNNIALTGGNDIRTICKPLYEYLDITYFNYVKLNPNGSRSTLTDRPDFISKYYGNKELFQTKAVLKMEKAKKSIFHLSCEFRDQLSYIVARNDFDIDNGLTIIQPCGKSTELYYFGTTKNNYYHTNLYLNNVEMFYRFIIYFKEKAAKLIQQADKQKFYLPSEKKIIKSPKEFNNEDVLDIRRCFFEATKINRYLIDYGHNIILTRREAECLYYIMFDKSSKEISRELGLSTRTIETHLMKAKLKLNCCTKKELISKLMSTELGRILTYAFAEFEI